MEELQDSCIDQELFKKLKLVTEFRQSYTALKNDFSKLQKENLSLKNMLMIAQNNEKHQIMYRNYSESIVIKQNKIIGNFINVKEENMKLKEEIDKKKGMLQSLYKEMEELREKTADEIKSAQEIHEEELAHYQEQYVQQEKQIKEEFEAEKLRLETAIKELKQTVETLNNEKNILVAVTVREYEDQLQALQDALNGSKIALQSNEDINNANIHIYKKKLEDQEKHYISMLEKIQSEVIANSSASTAATAAALKKQKLQKQLLSAGTASVSTTSSAINCQQQKLQKLLSVTPNVSTEQSLISNSRSSVPLSVSSTQSELFGENIRNIDKPANSSYYERLQLPPPSGQLQMVPKNVLYNNYAVASETFNDVTHNEHLSYSSKGNVRRQIRNRISEQFRISVHNFGANNNSNYHNSNDININNNCENTDCNCKNGICCDKNKKVNYPVSKKRKLYDPTSSLL